MRLPIKILHIDDDQRIHYILIFDGVKIKSPLPLETALSMLEKEKFDLILSVPHNLVVYTPCESTDSLEHYISQAYKESFGLTIGNSLN
jgi:hypothetical protein